MWYTGNGKYIHGNIYLYQFSWWNIFNILGVLNAYVWKTSHPLRKILVYIYFGVYVISYALIYQGMAN